MNLLNREMLTDEQWSLLRAAPQLVLLAVSASGGSRLDAILERSAGRRAIENGRNAAGAGQGQRSSGGRPAAPNGQRARHVRISRVHRWRCADGCGSRARGRLHWPRRAPRERRRARGHCRRIAGAHDLTLRRGFVALANCPERDRRLARRRSAAFAQPGRRTARVAAPVRAWPNLSLDRQNYQLCRSNCWANQSTTEPSNTTPAISIATLHIAPNWRGAKDGSRMLQRNFICAAAT